MRRTLALTPVDAWFFGGGQPYSRESSDQTNVRSIFPPNAPTVVGAIRAATARAMGWDGKSAWSTRITDELGNGLELGSLKFQGPMLLRCPDRSTDNQRRRLYPAPRHLLGKPQHSEDENGWNPATLLTPADEAVETDVGPMNPPVKTDPVEGVEEPDGVWLTKDGLRRVLHGRVPEKEDCLLADELWHQEPRVGLERDDESRRVEEGRLYSPSYVRLAPGVAIGTAVEGLPNAEVPDRLLFGGESRMANVEAIEPVTPPSTPPSQARETGQLTISFVTPCMLDRDTFEDILRPGATLDHNFGPLEGFELVSACLGKPTWIGGWHPTEQRPLALRPYISAGSTLFVEGRDVDDVEAVSDIHGSKIGLRTEYGFGEVVVGTWQQQRGN